MWKIMDSRETIEKIVTGNMIGDKEFPSEYFKVVEVNENGIIHAENTVYTDYRVMFLKSCMADARWWVMG
jgi:hypothetical protein